MAEVILEERQVPEHERILSRKTTFRTEQGIVREITHPFCDYCGVKLELESKIALCCGCGMKLGPECILVYDGGRSYCLRCVKGITNLSTEAMKVLLLIHIEQSFKEMKRTLHMKKQEVKEAAIGLFDRQLVNKKFLSSIRGYTITHRGLDLVPIVTDILQREGRL